MVLIIWNCLTGNVILLVCIILLNHKSECNLLIFCKPWLEKRTSVICFRVMFWICMPWTYSESENVIFDLIEGQPIKKFSSETSRCYGGNCPMKHFHEICWKILDIDWVEEVTDQRYFIFMHSGILLGE